MPSPNRSYRVELAQPVHDEGMAKLLEESTFDGPIAVSYRRRPSVIASFAKESEEALLYVLIDQITETVVGMGAVTIRSIWLGGEVKRLAYLSGLRITPAHQKAFLQIPRMYEQMYQTTKDRVDLYLTTIVEGNEDVIRMFEKKRRSMPEYRLDAMLETFLLGTKRKRAVQSVLPKTRLDGAVSDPAFLSALGAEFYGTPSAGGYLLEPNWKQYHIAGYRGFYKALSVLPTKAIGLPRFPKPGENARYLAGGVYANERIGETVELLRSRADGADFLMLCARSDSPLAAYCRTQTPVVYRTRLYQVLFHGAKAQDLSDMAMDVSFL